MAVAIVGVGRTGARTALEMAATPGLTLIDRDCVEKSDLKDSPLYGKVDEGRMKAEVAAEKIGASSKAIARHLSASNISELLKDATVVLDCTDNWGTRALINEYCWKTAKPWVYCGALAGKAMCSAVVPPEKPCWLCWNPKEPAELMSCSEYGIDAQAAQTAAQLQAREAEAILEGNGPRLQGRLFYADARRGTRAEVRLAADKQCSVCSKNEFQLLEGDDGEPAIQTCGTGQWLFVNAGVREKVRHYTIKKMAAKLASLDPVHAASIVKVMAGGAHATVFADGRLLVRAKTAAAAAAANEFIVQKLLA